MKRKSLLFALLLAIGLPWAANAQETVEIGTGTDQGTTTNNYLPGYTLYDNTLSEQIYTAEEVGMAGTISSIAFYNGGSTKSPTVTLYMVNTDQEAFSSTSDWLTVTSGDFVFEGSVTFTANEWTTIELDTPFEYDGTSNLGLVAHIHMSQYSSGLACRVFSSTSNCSMYAYRDNTVYDPTNPGVTGSGRLSVKNQIKLEITPSSGPSCEKPSTFEVSDVDAHSASFAWTSEVGNYTFEYKKASASDWTVATDLSANTYSLTDLDAATAYNARVKAVCGTDLESGYKTVNFTTPCEAITTFPWTENFDSYTGTTSGSTNNLPQCYNYINGTTYSYYAGYPVIYNGSSNSANNHLRLYSYYTSYGSYTYTDQYAILPQMEGLRGMMLTLYAKAYNASSSFTVGMMTDPTDATTFEPIDTKTPSTTEYEKFTFILGEGNYVAFKMEPANSSSTYRGIYIDDIMIDEVPSCLEPTDLQHTGSTTTTATLSWTNGSEDQTAWQICLNGDEDNLIMANSNPFTIENLDASSTYTAKVRAYCSATDQSYWSNEIGFATECDAISNLPWNENFDAYTAEATSTTSPTVYPDVALPVCWQFLNRSETSSAYPQAFLTSSTTYAVSGNCLFFKSSSTTPLYAILPDFEEEIAGLQLTFTYRNEGTTTSNGQLIVGYMTNPADASTFIEMLTCDRTSTLTEKEVLFADAPAGSYIAFKYQGGSSNNYYLSIDNVSVDYAPSCPKPQSLAVTANSVTAHGATVTWTEAGEATQWIVEFATDADFTDVLNETVNNEPTYTFQGLDPETTYYVRVYAQCAPGNASVYSNVVNFTTDEACKVPANLTVSDVTVTSATLSWTESGDATVWQICLNDDQDNLINATETTWTLENLTAETVYTAKVRGYCNEAYTDWSSAVSFEPTAKLVIGSGTGTTGYLPTNTNYDFSYTQQIYTVAELGEAGVIESIDFYMTTTDYTRNLDIYMVNTDKESFANNTDWIAVTNADLVFSGNVNFTANSWTTITLNEGFIYNGTQNVAIIVDDNTEEWSSRNFRSFTVESNQAHYCYQDNTNINPSAPSASNNSVTTSKNQIRILKSEMSDCMKPTQFTATEVGPDFVVLDWTENGTSESWYIFYQDTLNPGEVFVEVFEHPYTLTSLNNETTYSAFVVPSCGVEYDDPDNMLTSRAIEFTTLPGCPVPQDVEVSNITHTSANVSWTGYSDSYNIMLGEPTYIVNADFENTQIPSNFTNDATYPWTVVENNHSGAYCAKSATGNNSQTSALELEVTLPSDLTLTFSAKVSSESGYDKAYFSIDDQVQINGISGAGNWIDYSYPLTAGTHTLRWYYTKDGSMASNDDCFYVDDIQIIDGATVLSNYTSNTNSYDLSELTPGTSYAVQVQAVCGDQTSEWSEVVNFTAPAYKHFVTEGDWNVASNWEPAGLPEEGDDVFIDAPAIIPANYLANVGHVTLGANGAITIADGGQLRHTNAHDIDDVITVTLEKVINAYEDENIKSGYYFIAPAPFYNTIAPSSVINLRSNNYDFYSFSAANELEWINLHDSNNSLKSAHGYLYANSDTVTLKSTGKANSITGGASVPASYYDTDYEFNGWSLAGNPFVCNSYVYVNNNNGIIEADFYRMNEAGDGYDMISSDEPVKPFEGVLLYTETAGTVRFSPDPIESNNNGKLNMNLTRNGKRIDMARVRFGQGQNFGKMSFRENSSKVYMTIEGKDYASVFSTETMGEMPVSFKAEENGTYTLGFTVEEVSFSYLHLIDNMTGNDVDLLQNPSYSFEAKTTDYASRFKLVFTTGNADDTFAFFSNGSFVINNEGNATLQVIDVTGRIIKSESINGCANVNVNATAGVYMLRLINGDNVKVQKMVVR